ncbi:MAG: nuclear transport factor 2 family protein [Candidatus Binatia bacterium]
MSPMTLQAVADRLEIDDLLTRYATAVDQKDWDLYASCFTPDAFIDYTPTGGIKGHLPEIREWLAKVMPMFAMSQHLVTNRVIVVRGDTATARSALFNPMGMRDGAAGLLLFFEGAYYNDRLVRTADGWRIAERIEESCYTTRRDRVFAAPADGSGG